MNTPPDGHLPRRRGHFFFLSVGPPVGVGGRSLFACGLHCSGAFCRLGEKKKREGAESFSEVCESSAETGEHFWGLAGGGGTWTLCEDTALRLPGHVIGKGTVRELVGKFAFLVGLTVRLFKPILTDVGEVI